MRLPIPAPSPDRPGVAIVRQQTHAIHAVVRAADARTGRAAFRRPKDARPGTIRTPGEEVNVSDELRMELMVPTDLIPGGVAIRTRGTSDAPLFNLVCVCEGLGYADPLKAASEWCNRLDGRVVQFAEDLGETQPRPGRPSSRSGRYITESDLYRVVLGSDAKNATRFMDWVCGDVLPTIRRHGCYPAPAASAAAPDIRSIVAREVCLLLGEAKAPARPAERMYQPRKLIREWWPDCDPETQAKIVRDTKDLYREETGEEMSRAAGCPDNGPLQIEASRLGCLVEAFSFHFKKAHPPRPPELPFRVRLDVVASVDQAPTP